MAVVFGLAACGEESTQELTFELNGKGEAVELTAPENADSGEAEITFTNSSDRDGELQLIRVEGDHTAEEVVEGLESAMKGKPFPDFFFAGGGVSTTKPGESITVTQVLEPGTYFATDTETKLDSSNVPATEVTGDQSDAELASDTTVEASEYSFTAEGLTAGENEIDFANIGAQPHHLIIAPLKGDATVADVEKALKSENEAPPIDEKGSQSTAVIEGGESQLVNFNLKPGRYALLCFISDRQGGPPHAFKGMVDEVEVD
jgi:hypothetical protein